MSDEVQDESIDQGAAPEAEVSQGVEAEASAPVETPAQPEQTADVASYQQAGVWSHFRNLPQFQGQQDEQIAQSLYQSMQQQEAAERAIQQYQQIVPAYQDYLTHREQFEQWKAHQAQASQQMPAEQEKPWWDPPQLKDSHKRYLIKDEQGRDVIDPNAPIDARAALEDYMEFRANFAQKFLDNPEEALGPMVDRVAQERAEAIIDQRLTRMNDENYVKSLESENKDWLYDESGNVSPEGLSVQKYIADAKSFGINGAKARWEFATKMVERDLLLAYVNQQQAQQPQVAPQQAAAPQQPVPQPTAEQKNMEYLRQQAMRTASKRQTSGATDARTPKRPMTFEEKLLSAARDQGMV